MTVAPKANLSSRFQVQSAYSISITPPSEVNVGTVCCELRRTYTLPHQTSIFRLNRQVYHEATDIFWFQNFWTLVRVNKEGFGKEMKDSGFPIILLTADESWRQSAFPVLKVKVVFASLRSQNQSDLSLVPISQLQHLVRVLWTANGALEMVVKIKFQQPFRNPAVAERYLLRPFKKLRGIKEVIISGATEQKYIDELTGAISVTAKGGIIQTFGELAKGAKLLENYIKTDRWEDAIDRAEEQATLVGDCLSVYYTRFIWMRGLSINALRARTQAAQELILATTKGAAEITLHLQQYSDTVDFASLGLIAFDTIQPDTEASPPQPITGTTNFNRETRCEVLLLRARAYMGKREAQLAWSDIEQVRAMMPNSMGLAVTSRAWELMFDSNSGSTPVVSSSSARTPTLDELVEENDNID